MRKSKLHASGYIWLAIVLCLGAIAFLMELIAPEYPPDGTRIEVEGTYVGWWKQSSLNSRYSGIKIKTSDGIIETIIVPPKEIKLGYELGELKGGIPISYSGVFAKGFVLPQRVVISSDNVLLDRSDSDFAEVLSQYQR